MYEYTGRWEPPAHRNICLYFQCRHDFYAEDGGTYCLHLHGRNEFYPEDGGNMVLEMLVPIY
jgi:hypothetical protein